MQRLPEVVCGELCFGLPLPDATAMALLATLCDPDGVSGSAGAPPEAPRQRFVELLRVDPALGLWTALHAPAATTPQSLEELSQLLAAQLPQWLQWPPAPAAGGTKTDLPDAQKCAQLAVASTQHASGPGTHPLLDLLQFAGAWLEMSVPQTDAPNALPARREIMAALPHRLAVTENSFEVPPLQPDSPAADAVRRHWQHRCAAAALLPEVARRLARLADLEVRFDQTLETEKLQALYKLAAGAGHEINNPLGSIAGRAQLLLRDEADPERRRTLAKINAQAFRAHEMIADMMLFARPPVPVRASVNLAELAAAVLANLKESAAERQIELTLMPDAVPVIVQADAGQLHVALRAVVVNALDAIGSGGHVHVMVRREDAETARPPAALMVVRDDGPGITAEVRRHLFDPFFSGREAGRGLGFGLSKCWRIVTLHGGRIDVESTPGEGAQFTLTLPCA